MYKLYDIDTTRKWGNQFGEFKPGNHVITSVEWIGKKVDVYDIETEKYHNFFANEICVHNSSNGPNLQNVPKRDKTAMSICRGVLFPHEGQLLIEADYGALEVKIACAYHKDPVMLKYMHNENSDMHKDTAEQLFLLDKLDRDLPEHEILRNATKNSFIFPEFYGDYYKNCTKNLACKWGKLPEGKWKPGQGVPMPEGTLSDHLINKGIKSYTAFEKHVQDIENDFWGNRFKEYARWKERWYRSYQKNGYVDSLTGFRFKGVMSKNDVINYPVQSAAFHVLLKSFILLDELILKEKLKSRIMGQVHDSLVISVALEEKEYLAKEILKITTVEVPRIWTWINAPLSIEIETTPIDKSWAELEKYELF